jgi:hypothetical protein
VVVNESGVRMGSWVCSAEDMLGFVSLGMIWLLGW